MKGGMDRRAMLKGTAALAGSLMLPRPVEAAPDDPDFALSSLDPAELQAETLFAASQTVGRFWPQERLKNFILENYFPGVSTQRQAAERLAGQSRAYIPQRAEIDAVIRRSIVTENQRQISPLKEHAKEILPNKYGIYVDGDTQRAYLLKSLAGTPPTIQFHKAFTISTSAYGYSNETGSDRTPLGQHRFAAKREGFLGEVVSAQNSHRDTFAQVPISRPDGSLQNRTFARGLRRGRDRYAELLTTALVLWGPRTSLARGAAFHGTNFEDSLGTQASLGCIRMANVDINGLLGRDIHGLPYIETAQASPDGRSYVGGTPIMIFASESRREAPVRHTSEGLPPGFRNWRDPE